MVKRPAISAIVLCGGRSSRMGHDKASLPFGDETLLDRVLRQVATVADDVVLAAAPAQPVPAGVRVSRDATTGVGPLPALVAALHVVNGPRTVVVACDLPLLRADVLALLIDESAGWDGAVPLVDGRRVPTCAAYQTAALRHAGERFGDPRHRSLRDFIALWRLREVPASVLETVDPQLSSFTPCNTLEEYRRAQVLAGLEVNGPPLGAV